MQELAQQLKSTIKSTFGIDFDPEITVSPENISADFSSNAPLKLAKTLHQAPLAIAKELAHQFARSSANSNSDLNSNSNSNPSSDTGPDSNPDSRSSQNSGPAQTAPTATTDPTSPISQLSITVSPPGFINFALPDAYYANVAHSLSQNFATSVQNTDYQGQTIICEFSDPNPFKVLHVGHLYTSIVGDAISRLYENAGARVIRANFGGDVGLHVAKTMYILQQKPKDTLTIDDIARCYVEGTAVYADDPGAKADIDALNQKIYAINANNEHGTPLADLYWQGRELSYAYFKDFYAQIGITFDKFYPESTVAALGLSTVKTQLKNGVYEASHGAVIFDGEKYGLHARVFINHAGVPTYEAKDVGLIFTKWQDYHFDRSVVITGSEQLEYMKVVLKSVEQYAPELVAKTTHLTHGLVKLPGNVKMSSRKGNFLKAVDVLELIDTALFQEYQSNDHSIALAATKYAFLKYKMGGNIIFDPHESVKMTGNSGPYLLYSCVRAQKILEKSPATALPSEHYRYNVYEKSLLRQLAQYQSVLQLATRELAPHKLATYLYELAQAFSRFYEHCPVSGAPEEPNRRPLVQAYLNVMTHGLALLGITSIPGEM